MASIAAERATDETCTCGLMQEALPRPNANRLLRLPRSLVAAAVQGVALRRNGPMLAYMTTGSH